MGLEDIQQCGDGNAFSSFLKAIYEDYDLEKAIELVEKMAAQANDDFLLRNYVFDIKKQAYLLIFQTKCKLFRTIDIKQIEQVLGAANPIADAIKDIQRNLQQEGFAAEVDEATNTLSCSVQQGNDPEI